MKIFGGLFFIIVIAIVVFGWLSSGPGSDAVVAEIPETSSNAEPVKAVKRHYQPVDERHFKKPRVEPVILPDIGRTDVSWGAVGSDSEGNIYVGLAESEDAPRSAYLVKINAAGQATVMGDVVSELKRAGIAPASVSQGKIHSQIVAANDGYLYFSSFDEAGETEVRLPDYGGHLWRLNTLSGQWQHLLATPEALIAVNTDGRYVYALGYWGHVLYQFDTQSAKVNKTEVGSIPGHVSRQFLVDGKGHVYVPKLSQSGINEEPSAMLVEFDQNLNPVTEYPLPDYSSEDMTRYRGIVAYTNMRNGDVYFTLGQGYLLQVQAAESGAEKLINHGLFNPAGEANIPSLFTVDGEQFVMGVSRRSGADSEWLIYEKISGATVNYAMPELNDFLFFGTEAKDAVGNFYLVGRDTKTGKPKVVRITFPE
ncbi:MAG: hypothetical protein VYD53_01580 [Pseudomonadota bacterium]|nr:hypothetical protein [Pseudomonadota bacterium]